MKPRDVERRFVMCELLFQRQKTKDFLHRIVTGDEKWIHTIIQNVENRGVSPVMHQHRPQNQIPMVRSFFVFGGISRVQFIMSCSKRKKLSRGSLSTSINAFETIPKRKTSAMRAEERQSDFVTWQCSHTNISRNKIWKRNHWHTLIILSNFALLNSKLKFGNLIFKNLHMTYWWPN